MNLLIVDDSETDRFVLEQSLQDHKDAVGSPLEIDFAENAEQAIDRATRQNYSLILLDISMPGRDGFFVLQNLRQSLPSTAPPIYMLSSSTHDRDIAKAYKLLANGYLVKPSSLSDYDSLALTCLALADRLQLPKTLH